jgi:UDP-2-acetamido-3-amino-2,3-dideoxy-glucuronate N-acetyltransferase
MVFVHPQALCESSDVGPGTRVWAFAHVMDGARVGPDCNVGGGAFIESGAVVGANVTIKNGVSIWDRVIIEDDVFLGPSATFTNDLYPRASFKNAPTEFLATVVRRGSTIGANATIVCGTIIGEGAFVAAGAVVTKDVLARALVAGNPATRLGWVCDCGERLEAPLTCGCGRTYVEGPGGLELQGD